MNQLTRIFRSKQRRATELEMAAVLFESVLGRRASESDLRSAAPGLWTPGGLQEQVAAMINSPEFAIMRLPHLLAEASKNYRGEKVFFLHVPKTAGTSLRVAFIEAMGIPALDRYNRVGRWDGYSQDFIKTWPLLVGHTNLYNFPEGSHRGVTVFRESRARTLSSFRQMTRAVIAPPVHFNLARTEKSRLRAEEMVGNFSGWLLKAQHPLDLFTWHVAMPSGEKLPTSDEVGINRTFQAKALANYSDAEIRRFLERGLQRIQFAEWQHNRDGMANLVERTLGRPVGSKIPKENQVLPEQTKNVIRLTKDDHVHLSEIAAKTQTIFDLAADQGLIKRLTKTEADEQFEIAASRLGFIL